MCLGVACGGSRPSGTSALGRPGDQGEVETATAEGPEIVEELLRTVLAPTGLTCEPKLFSLSWSKRLFAACHPGTLFGRKKISNSTQSEVSWEPVSETFFNEQKEIQICDPSTGAIREFTDDPSKAWSLRYAKRPCSSPGGNLSAPLC